jgi:hypothetical protein
MENNTTPIINPKKRPASSCASDTYKPTKKNKIEMAGASGSKKSASVSLSKSI